MQVDTRLRMHRLDRRRPTCFPTRKQHLHIQGVEVDPCVCYQRYCPFRRMYVVLSWKDSDLLLETRHRYPALELIGAPGPQAAAGA
jgi:hypothetical protein